MYAVFQVSKISLAHVLACWIVASLVVLAVPVNAEAVTSGEDVAEALQRRLDAEMERAAWSLAEVNWPDVLALRATVQEAIDKLRTEKVKKDAALALAAEEEADQGLKELSKALYGSRVAETRAFWIDDEILSTMWERSDVALFLDRLDRMGINAIYLDVNYNSRTIYPSALVPQIARFAEWSEDPLQVFLEEAHARKIEVHAWYIVFNAGVDAGGMPEILVRNPDWAAENRFGEKKSREGGVYGLDPAHPGAQQYVLDLFEEALRKYALDGLHLDYIRYDGDLQLGPATRARFKQLTGKEARQVARGSTLQQQLNAMRQDIITDFVKRTRALVDQVSPKTYVSAAVASGYSWALSSRMQRWAQWVEQRLLDFVVPMVYTRDMAEFTQIMDEDVELVNETIPIEVGIGTYYLRPDGLSQQIQEVRKRTTAGVALFAAVHLNQIYGMDDELEDGVFRRRAEPVRNSQAAAKVYLADLVVRLRDEAKLLLSGKPEGEAFLKVAQEIEADPAAALGRLDALALPQETRAALRHQIEYALYLAKFPGR